MKKLAFIIASGLVILSPVYASAITTDKNPYQIPTDTQVVFSFGFMNHPSLSVYDIASPSSPIYNIFFSSGGTSKTVGIPPLTSGHLTAVLLNGQNQNNDCGSQTLTNCLADGGYVGQVSFDINDPAPTDPCVISNKVSSSTVGCFMDGMNTTVTGFFDILISKYWPFVVGFIILVMVWFLGKRILANFS